MSRKVVIRGALAAAVERVPQLYAAAGIELADCLPHGGRVTLADLERIGAYTPTVLLTVLRLSAIERRGLQGVTYRLQWAAYPVASAQDGREAHDLAAEYAETLIGALPGETWGRGDCEAVAAEAIDAANLYSGAVAERGMALWGITWDQAIYTDPRRMP